jgi:cytoskeletal protein RodZ
MNQIGQLLKEARIKKGYSLGYLESKTKIRRSFIVAIEGQKWEVLPAFTTVLGFVKSISSLLDINEKTAIAVLKRDYPPQKLRINPKPDVSTKFSWSPKLTFTIGTIAVFLLVFGYLIFQYFQFISPPSLTVDSPKNGQVITDNNVLVFGETNGDVKITVNNQPVLVNDSGKFSVSIEITPETKDIIVIAISRSGKETMIRRTINVQSN